MTRQCYSIDDENFNIQDLSEVFDTLSSDGELVAGRSYWVADAIPLTPEYVFKHNINALLEQLDTDTGDDIGEVYDNDFSNVTDEAKAELQTLLVEWAKKNVHISRYYFVKNSVEKFITDQDISDYSDQPVV